MARTGRSFRFSITAILSRFFPAL